jgi:hypothetical protein
MGDTFRGWISRHRNVVLSFVVGMSLGVLIVAFAYFSSRSETGAMLFRYGVRISGHSDIDEDLIWFVCGIVAGAGIMCYAWWRDTEARSDSVEEEHVLNRVLGEDPAGPAPIRAVPEAMSGGMRSGGTGAEAPKLPDDRSARSVDAPEGADPLGGRRVG